MHLASTSRLGTTSPDRAHFPQCFPSPLVFDNDRLSNSWNAGAGMVRPSDFSASKEKECPQCGSLYDVRMVRLLLKDRGSYDCLVCDHRLATWNDTKFSSYRLIKIEPWPKPKKV